uniref:Uncharacterized protein n=1 Tax=Xiangshan rhabdo-like virus 5 TaxID=2886228 RepID=A0A8K1YQQ5_9RHAB|nr:MAG: hypothetical protein [Xiangshan rhabdo-like virus 5]
MNPNFDKDPFQDPEIIESVRLSTDRLKDYFEDPLSEMISATPSTSIDKRKKKAIIIQQSKPTSDERPPITVVKKKTKKNGHQNVKQVEINPPTLSELEYIFPVGEDYYVNFSSLRSRMTEEHQAIIDKYITTNPPKFKTNLEQRTFEEEHRYFVEKLTRVINNNNNQQPEIHPHVKTSTVIKQPLDSNAPQQPSTSKPFLNKAPIEISNPNQSLFIFKKLKGGSIGVRVPKKLTSGLKEKTDYILTTAFLNKLNKLDNFVNIKSSIILTTFKIKTSHH